MSPHEALALALDDMAERDRQTPCQADPDPFTSDDRQVRVTAAQRCQPCSLLALCAAAGEGEEHWVWGGRDRTKHARRTPKPEEAA